MPGPKVNLKSPIFHDEDAARVHLESLLWPDGPVCPKCGVMGDRITKLQGKSTRPGVYKCKDCRKPFTVTVGTVMERSHIPLSTWVLAAQFMASSKKSMSALQLQRMIGTNYETAWFLFHRLREASNDLGGAGPLGGKGKVVEADETFIGGLEKNKHMNKRKHRGTGGEGSGKKIVFSLVERDGYVRSRHVADITAKTLRNVIVQEVDRKTHMMTDEALVYSRLGREFFGHSTVNHSKGQYADGEIHTNTIEGFFSLVKRAVYRQFHNVSAAHLHRYLCEADFKYNTRALTDAERAAELLRGAKGKRLLYRQPDETRNA